MRDDGGHDEELKRKVLALPPRPAATPAPALPTATPPDAQAGQLRQAQVLQQPPGDRAEWLAQLWHLVRAPGSVDVVRLHALRTLDAHLTRQEAQAQPTPPDAASLDDALRAAYPPPRPRALPDDDPEGAA